MVDDNILRPGGEHCHHHHHDYMEMHHLFKENFLSEFLTDWEKEIARKNLDLIAKSDLPKEVVDIVNYAIYKKEIDVGVTARDLQDLTDALESAQEKIKKLDIKIDENIETAITTLKSQVEGKLAELKALVTEEVSTTKTEIKDSLRETKESVTASLEETKNSLNQTISDFSDSVNETIEDNKKFVENTVKDVQNTNSELDKRITALEEESYEVTKVIREEAKWIPKGPVQSMVGFIEDETEFPEEGITLQQLADAIFYGSIESEAEIFVGLLTEAQKVDWVKNGATKDKIDEILGEQGYIDEELEVANNKYHYFNATIQHQFSFDNKDLAKKGLRYIVIAYPNREEAPYPKLRRIETGALQLGPDAFLKPAVVKADEFNYYIYKVGITLFDTSILIRF